MNDRPVSNLKPRKWYNSYQFPLIPVLTTRPANEHNTASFTFNWLIFKLWSLDSFEFEIGFSLSGHWGIGFLGILPRLRWVLAIPFPEKWSIWLQQNTWKSHNLKGIK